MLTITKNQINLTRGDTGKIAIAVTDLQGNPYSFNTGDKLTLTIRKNVTDRIILQKRIDANKSSFTFIPSDTQNMQFGTYIYDVELMTASKDIFTIITPSKFVIGEEVTY